VQFSEVVNQASALLPSKGSIAYGALKREFDLDDEALEDLKEELIKAARNGEGNSHCFLGKRAWTPRNGDCAMVSTTQSVLGSVVSL